MVSCFYVTATSKIRSWGVILDSWRQTCVPPSSPRPPPRPTLRLRDETPGRQHQPTLCAYTFSSIWSSCVFLFVRKKIATTSTLLVTDCVCARTELAAAHLKTHQDGTELVPCCSPFSCRWSEHEFFRIGASGLAEAAEVLFPRSSSPRFRWGASDVRNS